ncbi:MAG: TlyA family RNA methyltransferase [Rhodospirillales bacterium]|nr:TlyA family RNA methyltransferase [Rhodospirillales bacterium]
MDTPKKRRLDQLLVERGLAENPAKAQAFVLAGRVFSGERRLEKAGQPVDVDIAVEVRGPVHPWVSRGALKLVHGLDHFAIDPKGQVCLDIGVSTGGFTEVLLARGATKVYAIDVGRGQIAWKLRQDPRVILRERTHARDLDRRLVPDAPSLAVCDVSFISLMQALPAPLGLIAAGGTVIALIKPQFEVGKNRVGVGGIVREPRLHREACETIRAWLAAQSGWTVLGITESPITGADGNHEFLIAARRARVGRVVP